MYFTKKVAIEDFKIFNNFYVCISLSTQMHLKGNYKSHFHVLKCTSIFEFIKNKFVLYSGLNKFDLLNNLISTQL